MAVYDRVTIDGITKLLADGANLSGYTEVSSVAAYTHAAGSCFTLNGLLYKATVTISEGSDIIEHTNCERAYVADAISDVEENTNKKLAGFITDIGTLNGVIFERGINLYDPSLQTPETISPHYYVNGVPYSSTQFDNAYNCTALIPIEPNTTYTIGLIGSSLTNPWGSATQRGWSYDANGDYISGSNWQV